MKRRSRSKSNKTTKKNRTKSPSPLIDSSIAKSNKQHLPKSLSFSKLILQVFQLSKKLWYLSPLTSQPINTSTFYFNIILSFLSVIFSTYMNIQFTYIIAKWTTLLTDKNEELFFQETWYIGYFLLAWIPVNIVAAFFQHALVLQLEKNLTNKLIERYFYEKSYFHISEVPNAGVRTLAVGEWVRTTQGLFFVFFKHMCNLFAFSTLLVHISWNLFGKTLLFTVSVTLCAAILFGTALTTLNNKNVQQKLDLDYALVHVHECRESIAFHNGGSEENQTILNKFANYIKLKWDQLYVTLCLEAYKSTVSRVQALIPYLAIAPLYFQGTVEYGTIGQTARAFYYVKAAMGFFVDEFDNLADLSTATLRLDQVLIGLEKCQVEDQQTNAHLSYVTSYSSRKNERNYNNYNNNNNNNKKKKNRQNKYKAKNDDEKENVLIASNVKLSTPNNQIELGNDISFTLNAGQHLLITGRSGCGKSSFLRACAGLWSVDKGTIHLGVTHSEIGYLPQISYFPFGSLRTVLMYGKYDDENSSRMNDGMLINAILNAQLGDLLTRLEGGLDCAPIRWSELLSSGELQRLAFARIFVHQPKLLFADESTSAVDVKTERILYEQLMKSVETIVSVGHRESLNEYHSTFLHCNNDGWHILK